MIAIREGGLDDPRVVALLESHFAALLAISPEESTHFLDLSGLAAADVNFWTAWEGDDLLGCGALKQVDSRHGEIKSMRTALAHLRRGAAAGLVAHILATARARDYAQVSLETGLGPAFEPAHALYRRFGFVECGPFADYREDPFSRFYTLAV